MKLDVLVVTLVAAAIVLAACPAAPPPQPTPTPPPEEAPVEAPTPAEVEEATVYILSNSSPHISVIDAATHQVVETADIPDFTSWTWNDDNNYFDGQHLWLGMRDPDTDEVEVVLLDLDTLEISERIPLGTDDITLYIGKPSREGTLHVSKHASGQVAVIDIESREVLQITDVPVSGGVACDMDTIVAGDGVERAYVPTDDGDTVIALDPTTLEVLATYTAPEDTRPFMLTALAEKNQVWVQERTTNANVILDGTTLEVIDRVLTGEVPIVNTFSPDGQLSYIGHTRDTVVTVVDTDTLEEVQRITVGTNPQKLGVHPSGKYVYAILTQEAAVAVVDTDSWEVTQRIPLGTNPTGIYVRAGS